MKAKLLHYIPLVVPVLLIVLQALIDNGVIVLSQSNLALANALLVSLGLGALHVRTKQKNL